MKITMKQIAMQIALIGVAVGATWALTHRHDMQVAASMTAAPAKADKKALYWYDPMVPDQHLDRGGKSPFMDMQLVPKYADEGGQAAGVKVDAGVQQNLGIRLAYVVQGKLAQSVDAVASVQFNDRDVAIVQARSGGFVERVYARAPGDVVPAGAPLADMLVPEWAAAQTEFLALLHHGDRDLVNAARVRLALTGMPASLIAQVEESGQPRTTYTVATPIAGTIKALSVRAGMNLAAGSSLAEINGLGTVWLEAAVPEVQAGQLAEGQAITARFTAYSGESFAGKIIAVLPDANAESHTLRVRVELPNPKLRFKPGMFAQLHLDGTAQPALLVPSETVIRTGVRNVVIAALPGGRFQPVEVELGQEVDGKTEVRKGLTANEAVVASGQFLIDSEASLSGVLARMRGQP